MARKNAYGARPWFWVALLGVVVLATAKALKKDSTFIQDLHPQFRPLVEQWRRAMEAKGIPIRITFTYRSPETQAKLKAEGKSKVDFGWHNVGLAFDFLPKSSGGWVFPTDKLKASDPKLHAEILNLLRVGGDEGKKLGMIWGGDWSGFPDSFHLEWHPKMTISVARAKQLAEGDNFRIA